MNHWGIDVETQAKALIMRRLKRLKAVESVDDGGAYREDAAYSIVRVRTTMTEAQLDAWLYATGMDYVGVFAVDKPCTH